MQYRKQRKDTALLIVSDSQELAIAKCSQCSFIIKTIEGELGCTNFDCPEYRWVPITFRISPDYRWVTSGISLEYSLVTSGIRLEYSLVTFGISPESIGG